VTGNLAGCYALFDDEGRLDVSLCPFHPQPALFSSVANVLNLLRAEYSRDIATYIISGGSTSATNYQAGLIFVACVFGGFVFIWFFVLALFKCRGEEIFGCGAGYAVQRDRGHVATVGPTSSLDGMIDDEKSLDRNDYIRRSGAVVREAPTKEESGDEVSNHSSIPSVEEDETSTDTGGEGSTHSQGPSKPTAREKRVRIAFLFFAVLSMACVPLVVVFSFAPLKGSITQTDQDVEHIQDVVDQVQKNFRAIISITNSSMQVVESIPLNMSLLCPLFGETQNESYLGFDADFLVRRVQSLQRMDERLRGNISQFRDALLDVEDGLDEFETTINQTETFVWLVPVVLLLLCALLGIMVYGTVLAWRGEASAKFQRIMAYAAIPLFSLVCIMCWVFVITAAVSTASGSDACLYSVESTNESSPDVLLETLISASDLGTNKSYLYDAAKPYFRGCDRGRSLADMMTPFLNQLLDSSRFIWDQVSAVDSIGRDSLIELCGGGSLNDFLDKAIELADLLTSLRKTITSVQSALSCPNIRPYYVNAAHVSICTDATNATAAGFLLFLVIGISSLCMIALRSALQHEIQEEKVLKENEIAMNMIVDEHEEYLAYISRYKHEWEEYNGIDRHTLLRPTQGAGEPDWGDAEVESSSLNDCMSQETPYSQGKRASTMFDPYQSSDGDGRSHASTLGEVSFPSLHHDDPGELSDDEYLLRQHSLLLQGSLGAPSYDDDNDMDDALAPSESRDHALLMNQYSLPHAVQSGVSIGQDQDSLVSTGEECVLEASPTCESRQRGKVGLSVRHRKRGG
jgi:hypothetical protein